MCGLVGMVSVDNLDIKQRGAFKQMHIFDIVRGFDSSGIFTVTADDKYDFVKSTGFPDMLPLTKKGMFDTKDKITYHDCRVIAGHNRAATVGAVKDETAHPFDFDNVIGMHNGTLPYHSYSKFKRHREFDVDSQALFSEIDTDREFKDIYANTNGAMALVWWDKRDRSLNIVRNKERPLYYAWSKDKKTLYWASEQWMINVALIRSNINDFTKPEQFDIDTHYRYFPLKAEKNQTLYDVSSAEKLEPPKPYVAPDYYNGYTKNWWDYGESFYNSNKKNNVTKLEPKKLDKPKGNGTHLYMSTMISEDIMKKKLEDACPCVWCDKTPHITEAKSMIWFEPKMYLCEDCQNNPEAMEHIPYVLHA